MSEYSPVQSALDAEKAAREAVDMARVEAAKIRQQASEDARAIERRAQDRLRKLHARVDQQIESRCQAIEHEGAEAMRQLRREAIEPGVMTSAIERLVAQVMADDVTDD